MVDTDEFLVRLPWDCRQFLKWQMDRRNCLVSAGQPCGVSKEFPIWGLKFLNRWVS
jgi:hypothetical protein